MMLVVVARVRAVPGSEARIEAALRALVAPTRAEAGCLQYDLFRDADDPCVFEFFERWDSREAWEAHRVSEHMKASMAGIAGLGHEFDVRVMEQIA